MSNYTLFDIATGFARISGDAPPQVWPNMLDLYPGTDIVPGFSDYHTEYVVSRVITPRPEGVAVIDKVRFDADGIDEVTITGLAPDTLISIDDVVIDLAVLDGTFTFTTDTPGTHTIRCEQFPTQYQEFEIVAA